MLKLLRRLIGGRNSNAFVVDAYWCESSVKLPAKLRTPCGSNVTVVNVCVDIHYTVDHGSITLRRVHLSRGGGRIMGSNAPINVAAERTGEAWIASSVCSESQLVDAVQRDLSGDDSRLRRIMMGKWRERNRDGLVKSLADALNAQASPDEIAQLISNAGRGNDIVFTYTKPKGGSDTRRVSVQGVSGNSIRARDHKDGNVKNFRIDRITNARNA
jgi:hypothetical protein